MTKSSSRPSSPPPLAAVPRPADEARRLREHAMALVRRSLILDAARAAFFELGLEGTSMREIATRAGYTAGAIYSYFGSKEEIYGALLEESLDRLNARVAAAADAGRTGTGIEETARAFFAFYRENPRDLDLGFYLFRGMRPVGLTRDLDRHLNLKLRAALKPVEDALIASGLERDAAQAEVTALFAHMVGLLLLLHTGRIRMFEQEAQRLFEAYLGHLSARVRAVARA